MANTVKLNMDKATVRQLFKAVVKPQMRSMRQSSFTDKPRANCEWIKWRKGVSSTQRIYLET